MKSLYKLLLNRGQTFSFGLGALLALAYYGIVAGGLEEFGALGEDVQGTSDLFNFGLKSAMGLVVIAFVLLLGFVFYSLIANIKNSFKTLIGFGLILVIFFVLYSMADPSGISAELAGTMKEFGVSNSVYKLVSASIGTAVGLSGISILLVLFSEISNQFK